MNIFKISYKVVRANSDEIYKGFGFKHLSDVTQYYVHPNNQSYKGTTTLCQPIGESLILFSLFPAGNVFRLWRKIKIHPVRQLLPVPS